MLGEKMELYNQHLSQEHTAMSEAIKTPNDLPVSEKSDPGFGKDLLTEVLRKGARELLAPCVSSV